MKINWNLTLCVLAILLSNTRATAQTSKPLKIGIMAMSSEGADAEIRSVVVPLLAANPHYTLVSDSSWDMSVRLNCVYTSEDNRRDGVACSFSVTFSPDEYMGIEYTPGPLLIVGPNPDMVGHGIVADVLDASTPDKFKKATDHLDGVLNGVYKAVTEYNQAHPNSASSRN
jgi:hypothetical protein